MDEGQESKQIWRVNAEIFPGARHVHPKLPGKDDMRGPLVSGRRKEIRYRFGERGKVGRGLFW
jgi:hypothetical protein